MKCRICGFELDGTTAFCPMCGSKVDAEDMSTINKKTSSEFNWNTKDFPKPKELRDIKMEWTGRGMMSEDASEGFVEKIDPQPAPQPSYTPQPQYTAPQRPQRQPRPERPLPTWTMPEQKVADNTPLWATQPLWEAGHMPQQAQPAPQPVQPAPQPIGPQAFTASGYVETTPVFQTAPQIPVMPQPIYNTQPQPIYNTQPLYNTQPIYNTQQTPAYQPAPETTQAAHSPEQFHTFYTKNEEFQALLDQEYEKVKSMRGEEPALQQTKIFQNDNTIKAGDLSAFEAMIMQGTDAVEDVPLPTPVVESEPVKEPEPVVVAAAIEEAKQNQAAEVKAEAVKPELTPTAELIPVTEDNIADLFSKPISGEPISEESAAIVRNTIELRIQQLREQETTEGELRDQRKKRIADMQKAREEYFGRDTAKMTSEDVKNFSRKKKEEAEAPEEEKSEFEITPDYDDIPKKKRKRHHYLLKFIIFVLVVVAIAKGVVMALNYFIPENPITEIANLCEEAVIDIVLECFNQAKAFVTSHIQGIL